VRFSATESTIQLLSEELLVADDMTILLKQCQTNIAQLLLT
jgi:hypothetical protein